MAPTVSFHPSTLANALNTEMLRRVLEEVLPSGTVGEVWIFHVCAGKPIEVSIFMWDRSPALARLPISWLTSTGEESRVRAALEEALRDTSATALTGPSNHAA
jgi:hypothetical protein